jgi:hypothetical protein
MMLNGTRVVENINKHLLRVLNRRIRHLINRSEESIGVGQDFINRLRLFTKDILGDKALTYLNTHLDARDYSWRVSSAFSWKAMKALKKG